MAAAAGGPRPAIPLTLLTGFLGAGKTTLLNRLLKDPAFAGTAVIVNEFGEIGLDHLLVETAGDGIVELSAGCVCCTIRGQLADALARLLEARAAGRIPVIARVVVETTGLADPAPILALLTRHPALAAAFAFDGAVTVVDALAGGATLDAHDEAVRQVAVADRIVLAKTDRVPDTAPLVSRLRRLNPGAPVLDAAKGGATPAALTGCGPFDATGKIADVRAWLAAESFDAHAHHHHDVNRHDARIAAFALTATRPLAARDLLAFIDRLEAGHASKLVRLKGIVALAEDPARPAVIHAVQGLFSPPVSLPRWPDADRRTRIVVIGRDLDRRAVEDLFAACAGDLRPDTPDRQALRENPFAVPGFTA